MGVEPVFGVFGQVVALFDKFVDNLLGLLDFKLLLAFCLVGLLCALFLKLAAQAELVLARVEGRNALVYRWDSARESECRSRGGLAVVRVDLAWCIQVFELACVCTLGLLPLCLLVPILIPYYVVELALWRQHLVVTANLKRMRLGELFNFIIRVIFLPLIAPWWVQ